MNKGVFPNVPTGAEVKKGAKKSRKSGGLSGSSSDESNSEDSDKDDSDDSFNSVSSGDDDEDDFNPFKDDSSEDEEDGKHLGVDSLQTDINVNCDYCTIMSYFFPLDPWLIRKDSKKSKEKKNKKKKKRIDPDSIHSALLASGLGSTRPAFTTPIVKSTSNSTVTPGG